MSSAATERPGVASVCIPGGLDAIFDLAEFGVVVYDCSGDIRLASPYLRRLLGLNDDEWGGLHDFSALASVLTARLANRQHTVLPPWEIWRRQDSPAHEQLELADRERILDRAVFPIGGNGPARSGWVERYRDFTAERDLPTRLLQTDKMAALGMMVAGVAHELNNPLTTVVGYSNLLLERPLDPKTLGEVRHICQEAERAARIVRSLLSLSREAKLERIPVDLNEIIERTLRLCSYDLQRAGIAVELDLDPQLPSLPASPIHLQQVVLNLVLNSQQAIAGARRAGRILLRTCHGAEHVFLRVEDNGPGIPFELQSRIFEPFFTTKAIGIGTGLGLSIVAGIVRQHGGDIRVASTPGSGATFTLQFPFSHPEHLAASMPPNQESNATRRVGHILVLESEEVLGRLIVDALCGDGHQLEWVNSVPDALAHVARREFDLLICDREAPPIEEPELFHLLGRRGAPRYRRVLVIGSNPNFTWSSGSLRHIELPFLLRPFLPAELKSEVDRLLRRDGREQKAS